MRALLFASLVAVLAGCGEVVAVLGAPSSCVLDSDCSLSELCVNGSCLSNPNPNDCSSNADCDFSLVCRDNVCEQVPPFGDCSSDEDCSSADLCSIATGDCLPSSECAHAEPGAGCDTSCFGNCVGRASCDDDGDCAVSEQCDPTLLLCLPIGDCGGDEDCPLDAQCAEGICLDNGACADNDDCPPSQSCVDAACTRNDDCAEDSDCPSDQRCADGLCVRREGCASDDECAFDEHCVDGTCNVIGPCTDVDDCPAEAGIACLDGVCTRAPCGSDSECDDTLFCNGSESCDPRVGCAAGPAPTSTNLPACAAETCDEDTDTLLRTPRDQLCGDDSVCTDDLCDIDIGCLHPANNFQPADDGVADCSQNACSNGALVRIDNDDEVPVNQGAITDCRRAVCQGGTATLVIDDSETPVPGPSNDCQRQVCQNGDALGVFDDAELPPQGPINDCVREVCVDGVAQATPLDSEVPPQGLNNDCQRQVCSGGNVVVQSNDSEVPAGVGCKDGLCQNGAVTTVPNNANCSDAEVCTVGSCSVDGSCSQTPVDSLCNCSAGQTGLCLPDDARAPNSGPLAGCVCLSPTDFSCGVDDGVLVRKVLERFELDVTPAGAIGTTFTWDLVGIPVGAFASAQLLGNPTSSTLAFFQATTPSAIGVRDYQLRVTILEPGLPAQTCDVLLEAQKIPDTLEVSLFMDDALDVDLHLIGGVDATVFDFPFHSGHIPSLDNSDRDCFWENCPVCIFAIPGQLCTAVSPRIVDFDSPVDGAALSDPQDPQLDIDNQGGCFTGTNGDLQCIPEKITVDLPAAGTYFVFPYLWGDSFTLEPGAASTPSSTAVIIVIQCRGVTRSFTRTLSSIAVDGTTATATDPVRYLEPLEITIPGSGACSLP